MVSTKNTFFLLVVVGSLLANLSNGQYFSVHESSVLNRNGKRSYLLDLIRPSDSDSKNANNLMSDNYYLADKLSIRNKFKKFGRRANLAYEELRNKILADLVRGSSQNYYENNII